MISIINYFAKHSVVVWQHEAVSCKLLALGDQADERAFSATLNLFTIQQQQAPVNIPTSYCALVLTNILHCM